MKEAATMGKAQIKDTGLKTVGPDETAFWKIFVNGSDDLGIRGLTQALYEKGARWYGPRFEGDTYTNWLTSILRNMPEEEMGEFIAKMKTVTKNIPEYSIR
jgi:hypothetical protein